MRFAAITTVTALIVALGACAPSGHDAHDVAADLEGSVSTATVDRLLRDVDLQKSAVTISLDHGEERTFGASDQEALESYLRAAAADLSGDHVRLAQQVVDDTAPTSQLLTVTLEMQHGGATQFVPVAIELLRDGRRVLITHVRVMGAAR